MISDYKKIYDTLVANFNNNMPKDIVNIGSRFTDFCPECQYITFYWTKEKDYPYNIADNACRIEFKIDFTTHQLILFRDCNFELTKHDMDKSYLCMASLRTLCKQIKKQYFRKTRFKDIKDAENKMRKFIDNVTNIIKETTNGYPYHELKINIY